LSSEERTAPVYWANETAEPEFANKTMVKIVVLVRNFGFGIVGVMTQFLRKLFL
jgi:hypothetical protein